MFDENLEKGELLSIERHLQFLGYQTEFDNSWHFLILRATNSDNNFPRINILYVSCSYIVDARIACHEEKDMYLLYKKINELNYKVHMTKITYLHEVDAVMFQGFFNIYEKKDFGAFIQRFLVEIQDAVNELAVFLR